jgi:nicotinamide-nucleotide amidase
LDWVKPKLVSLYKLPVILTRTLKIFGLPEAQVDESVSQLLSSKNPTLATYAKSDGIYLRIAAKSESKEKAQDMISKLETDIRLILDSHIWGSDSQRIESVVCDLLFEKDLTLATMESTSGGLLASTISTAPESTRSYKGGLITNTQESALSFGINEKLILQYGTISAELTREMAQKSKKLMKSDIGLGVSVQLEDKKESSTRFGDIFISIDDGHKQTDIMRNYPGQRAQLRQRAVTLALFELRKFLLTGGENAPHN